MSDSTWWAITLINGERLYVPSGEGEALRQVLAARPQKDGEVELMFVEVEDVSGTTFVLRVDHISEMYLSTPTIRALDADPDGLLEEIRAHSQMVAARKWDEL